MIPGFKTPPPAPASTEPPDIKKEYLEAKRTYAGGPRRPIAGPALPSAATVSGAVQGLFTGSGVTTS